MLNRIDDLCNRIPSRAINRVTGGKEHSSMCARLYLYKRYCGGNLLVNFMVSVIDTMEPNHCEKAARHWRVAHKRLNCYFPTRYKEWLDVPI